MTTDLDTTFREIAEALVAGAPDVPAFDGSREIAAQAPRRWVPLSAAAAVAALGIGGLTVAGRGGHDDPASTEVASAPPPTSPVADDVAIPTLYPVIDNLPDDAAAEWWDDDVFASDPGAHAGALIGEIADDGRILSTLVVRAGVRLAEWPGTVEPIEVFGVAGSTWDESEVGGPAGTRVVVWGTPPYFIVDDGSPYIMLTGQPGIAGADPVLFLDAASPDFVSFTVADEAGPVVMTIGDLPDGFQVLAGPQTRSGLSASAVLRVTPSGSFVQLSTFNPLIEYGNVGALEPVDINGHEGWLNDDGRAVVWQVDESTWARAVAIDEGGGVALAESVTFVDREFWADLYDPQPASTGPEFTPITGPIDYPDPSETSDPEPASASTP